MAQIKIVCGHWIFGKNKWLFGVDKGMRSKAIAIEDKTSYDDFVHMVIKECVYLNEGITILNLISSLLAKVIWNHKSVWIFSRGDEKDDR